jgi:hypothetical protein
MTRMPTAPRATKRMLFALPVVIANVERSHPGPLTSDWNRDALPALADATGSAFETYRRRKNDVPLALF